MGGSRLTGLTRLAGLACLTRRACVGLTRLTGLPGLTRLTGLGVTRLAGLAGDHGNGDGIVSGRRARAAGPVSMGSIW